MIKKKEQYEGLKFNYSNVFELDLDKQRYVLEKTNVSDIWGVGSGLSNFLVNNKINNAFQLTKFNKDFAKKEKRYCFIKNNS